MVFFIDVMQSAGAGLCDIDQLDTTRRRTIKSVAAIVMDKGKPGGVELID